MKRYRDADGIFNLGACNPSGIALSIVEACQEMRAEPTHTGTQEICEDPAIRAMVYQLAYICGLDTTTADYLNISNALIEKSTLTT